MSWRPAWWLKVLKWYWPLNHVMAKATHLPVIGPLITWIVRPFFKSKSFNISYIPVNARIEAPASAILTQNIIIELIRQSSHRMVIKRCSCRDSKGCQNYPIENSCLLLGEDTQKISSEIASHISIEEALEHMQQKLKLGLIPLTGRVRMDDLYYGVPNRGRMLTVCFCCPCCCTVLSSARYFPKEFRSALVPLQGLRVSVDESKCVLCKTCLDSCFMEAIQIENDRIVHDPTRCIGCGRCSTVCPQQATRVEIEDCQAAVDEIMGRIKQRVDVS